MTIPPIRYLQQSPKLSDLNDLILVVRELIRTVTRLNDIVVAGVDANIRTIQLRRDTAANWTAANPVLAAGEIGVTTDTHVLKIGDGVTNWNTLPVNA